MALQNSWPGPNGLTSTTAARKNLAGLLAADATGAARPGVFAPSLTIVTPRSDMNVDIAAFRGAAVQFGGPILISNDGPIQLPSALVSPASGTNYYIVYVKQNESTSPGTDANNNVLAGATLSTASFAAARALLPPGALELATVQMPSGKTATNASGVTITQTFQYTAGAGGAVPFRKVSDLASWNAPAGAYADVFADTFSNGLYRFDGTNWFCVGAANGQRWFSSTPTSVVNGTLNADGSVSAAGGSKTLAIDGVISPRFRVYRIVITLSLSLQDGFVFQWMRNGSPVATGDYWGNTIGATAGGAPATSAINAATSVGPATTLATLHSVELAVSRADSFIAASGTCLSTGGNYGQRTVAFDYEGALNPVTGIYLSCNTANIQASSRVAVYGIA